ncbi:THO complex subunit 1 transcription elongation factor-domain-containing protein [Lasiosphaeria ovina]|uniref:THO complex subunit 1 transcription elongation factor-domain-containing protein n=1 Tax=Lasiosphaeria ovina TaxID=92902 RepID=A0AAE0TUG1_9PEZI|nr:THO complex subunit 1 transcription elongation factor-domain-containing protein [Lasiosphaeria ovina]
MPSATATGDDVMATVGAFGAFVDDLLDRADSIKRTSSAVPLDLTHFPDLQQQIDEVLGSDLSLRFAVIETAVRDTFTNLISTIPIESPKFVRVWDLFDILSILSDSEQCDPALLFWLAEELLDSQAIAGCRKVFDYLESRRERITAKHFKAKKLVILRTCNELLRRLSRALDPAFCGRLFIFMFQCFPLGDPSSVNLRGEYHVENVTTFDRDVPATEENPDMMDVDAETESQSAGARKPTDQKPAPKVAAGSDGKKSDKPLDTDSLYPIFWSLQEFFSQPKKLFDAAHFTTFKAGLDATMGVFQAIKHEQAPRSKDKHGEETKQKLRKKRDDGDDDLAGAFNPKYLTSRDLFKLEISDLAFRRNVLVQALIIMEFLLSLSPKAKEKMASVNVPKKSVNVTYPDQQLSEEDTKWVTDMKRSIADNLRQGPEGPYFYRMVETVLSRDKNWVRWKAEGCPSIELPVVSPETFIEAREGANELATNKRLRATPLGSLALDFLDDVDEATAMEKFKAPERYQFPDLKTFQSKISDDDFEIDMARTEQAKAKAIDSKASNTWRALRLASRFKLASFDKIDDDDKIDAIFEDSADEDAEDAADATNGEVVLPDDRRPVVLVGVGSSSSSLAGQFVAKFPGAFSKVPVHVTRKREDGETSGKDYNLVDTLTFNMLRDGDQLLEYSGEGPESRGISRKVVETISATGKVPVAVTDKDGAQQIKDLGFEARFIFVQPPHSETMEAAESAEEAKNSGFYDSVVDCDVKSLELAIFGHVSNGGEADAKSATADRDLAEPVAGNTDVPMVEAA